MAQVLGLFSYNGVEGVTTGWHEKEGRKVFVVHNGRSGRDKQARLGEDVQERLWLQIEPVLPELDQLIVYLGSAGCLAFTERLKAVPPAKIIFVTCGCLRQEKAAILESNGFGACSKLPCECGGYHTLGVLCHNFLERGDFEEAPLPTIRDGM